MTEMALLYAVFPFTKHIWEMTGAISIFLRISEHTVTLVHCTSFFNQIGMKYPYGYIYFQPY